MVKDELFKSYLFNGFVGGQLSDKCYKKKSEDLIQAIRKQESLCITVMALSESHLPVSMHVYSFML